MLVLLMRVMIELGSSYGGISTGIGILIFCKRRTTFCVREVSLLLKYI